MLLLTTCTISPNILQILTYKGHYYKAGKKNELCYYSIVLVVKPLGILQRDTMLMNDDEMGQNNFVMTDFISS